MPIEGFVIEGGFEESNNFGGTSERDSEAVLAELVAVRREIAERSGTILVDRVVPTVMVRGTGIYYRHDTQLVVDFPNSKPE